MDKTGRPRQPKSILVVEDEPIARLAVCGMVEAAGYRLCGAAASGERALELAAACRPDLVLMDINLGRGRMDGVATAHELRRRHGTPVVFVTAYARPDVMARLDGLEMAGYLRKPFGPPELLGTIERVVGPAA